MITFLDGPAKGQSLALQRAPLLLRITRTPDGKFDGLDQHKDSPRADEEVFVYILDKPGEKIGVMHVDGRDRKTGRRFAIWSMIAVYKVHSVQPRDTTLCDNAAWSEWAVAEGTRIMTELFGAEHAAKCKAATVRDSLIALLLLTLLLGGCASQPVHTNAHCQRSSYSHHSPGSHR